MSAGWDVFDGLRSECDPPEFTRGSRRQSWAARRSFALTTSRASA